MIERRSFCVIFLFLLLKYNELKKRYKLMLLKAFDIESILLFKGPLIKAFTR